MAHDNSIATRLFAGKFSESELGAFVSEAGIPYDHLGWDSYDQSLEIHGAAPDFRLSVKMLNAISSAGFAKVYVNHTDGWETHYTFRDEDVTKGWRVSYPHKRGDNGGGIWVEEDCPSWPRDWFKTGHVLIKQRIK